MRTLLLAFLSLLATALPGQSTQTELEARLIHKPMYLRGLWKDDKLRFDASGQITKPSGVTSPMLSAIDLNRVELNARSLVLTGHRVAVFFEDRQPTLLDLKETVHLEIAAPVSGDYASPLAAVFSPDLAGLAPSAPDFWQAFLLHGFDAPGAGIPRRSDPPTSGERAHRVGGGATPPRVTYTPQAEYSEQARSLKLKGNVLVYLEVSREGMPMNPHILRPAGAGLDEQAIKAVLGYRFRPAIENGSPVRVGMAVDVNFQ